MLNDRCGGCGKPIEEVECLYSWGTYYWCYMCYEEIEKPEEHSLKRFSARLR